MDNYYDQDEWDDNDYPAAYLLTFRTHGTWLHGSDKFSVSDSKKPLTAVRKLPQVYR